MQNQNDNRILQVNSHSAKSFISSVTTETVKIYSFASHLRDMQNILATAVFVLISIEHLLGEHACLRRRDLFSAE